MRKIYLLLFILSFALNSAFSQSYDPTPNPASIVQSGKARFTILTDHVIRMEYATDSTFIDQASLTFVHRHLSPVAYQVTDQDGWLIIRTKYSTVHYRKDADRFTATTLYIEYKDASHSFTWRPGMKDRKNLKGTTRTLDGVSGQFSYYGLKKIKLEDGILSRSGWCLIDDSERPLFDHSDWAWVQARSAGEVQDLYFFGYGSDYKSAMYDFTQIAGHMSLPPRYAFGIWYSRYWAYTEQDFKDIVAGYQTNNIPLDVLVIDMDWHLTAKSSPEIFNSYTPKPNGWTGFTWEKKYFPDYREFLSWTDTQHIQTCMNLHPAAGVQRHEAAYPAFAQAMGVDTTDHPAIPFDITNKKFAQNYFDILLHPYERAGVDFWWLDWQQWGKTNIKGVNPTFYLNYVHFSDMQRQGKRPLIFHRWGGLGNHRYEIGFSGDYFINWKSLRYQPTFTANAANVGFGFWSHDIGGHMNMISKKDKQDAELFTRWVEWGAFSPIFRTHATADPEIERRMWMYPPANLNAMRKALQTRYALLPYIYTMARYAYDSAISMVHPMYYEFPDMDRAYHLDHQYYFGTDMIIAPVTASLRGKETTRQTVWLPDGKWYDFRSNRVITGGRDFTGSYTLDEVPIFVRAGSIIPMQTAKLRIEGSVLDTLILTVYTGQSGTSRLYEDEGTTEGYRKDEYSFTNMSWQESSVGSKLTITPDGHTYPGQLKARSYEIRIVSATAPSQVKINGQPVTTWTYDAQSKQSVVRLPKAQIGALTMEVL